MFVISLLFLNQAHAGHSLPAGFFKLILSVMYVCACVYMSVCVFVDSVCVCVCVTIFVCIPVCLSQRLLITSGVM